MADTKISALPAAAVLGNADELVLNVAGANKKITGANLKASLGGPLTLLSSTTLGAVGTFDVPGIPATYNDLILVLIARVSIAGPSFVALQLNGDTGFTLYSDQQIQGTAGSVTGPEHAAGQTNILLGSFPGSSAAAGCFGMATIVIPGYASTVWNKIVLAEGVNVAASTSGGRVLWQAMGMWASTAAINRVLVSGNALGTFIAGSQLRVYGRL